MRYLILLMLTYSLYGSQCDKDIEAHLVVGSKILSIVDDEDYKSARGYLGQYDNTFIKALKSCGSTTEEIFKAGKTAKDMSRYIDVSEKLHGK